MKMKKVLSLALALLMAIGILAGCGGGSTGTKADISAFVDNDEKLTISWLGYPHLPSAEEGLPSELLLEEKFNVEIEPIFAEEAKYTDKKNALLQSDSIPDLIYELDPSHLFADARDEYLLEVPYEAIEKYAPTLYEDVNNYAPAAWGYSYYEDKNYGLPNINHQHVESSVPIYRKDWLDAVGKEVPETIDELHDVLYSFTFDDPDGNGKDDTYGYALVGNHWAYYFGEIFGAEGILPFDWQEVDGEIVYGGLRPECEDVLALLAQWYKDGVIYPAFVETDKYAQVHMAAGEIGYYYETSFVNVDSAASTLGKLKARYPDAEIVYGHPVKNAEGGFGARSWGYACHIVAFGNNDETSPVKVTRMLKMFETMRNEEDFTKEVVLGKEGVTYTVNENTKASLKYESTPDYDTGAKRSLGGYELNMHGPTYWRPFAPSKETYLDSYSDAYKAWMDEYKTPEAILTDAFFKCDVVPSAPTYLMDVQNNQMALMAEIIKGTKSADQYIEEFTKIWEATGGAQMQSEADAYQETLDVIYDRLGLDK